MFIFRIIELYVMPRDYNRGTWNHIAIEVDDATKLFGVLIANGLKCINSPVIDDSKKHKMFFFKDYDSNLLEIVEVLNKIKPEVKPKKVIEVKKTKKSTSRKPIKKVVPRNPNPFTKKPVKTINEKELEKE